MRRERNDITGGVTEKLSRKRVATLITNVSVHLRVMQANTWLLSNDQLTLVLFPEQPYGLSKKEKAKKRCLFA